MIIVRLMGGMGNQMFQYAFGRYLAEKNKTSLKLDKMLLEDRTPRADAIFRDYDLDIFNLEPDFAVPKEVWEYCGEPSSNPLVKVKNRINKTFGTKKLVVQENNYVTDEYLNLPDEVCTVGRWQSEKFFRPIENIIRKEFSFKNPLDGKAQEMADLIQSTNAVCLNVRRADYITHAQYSKALGFVGLEYYNKAIERLKQEVGDDLHIFIFSDDIEWCSENLKFDVPTTLVDHSYKGPKFQYYLNLMTQCKHFIIPNSTFGWWAAWLCDYKDKVVIAPEVWSADGSYMDKEIVPEDWLRV